MDDMKTPGGGIRRKFRQLLDRATDLAQSESETTDADVESDISGIETMENENEFCT